MELGDYHLGLLPASQALRVVQHVRECPHCRREVEQLGTYLKDLESPAGVVEAIRVLVAKLLSVPGEIGSQSMAPALRGERRGPLQFAAEGVLIVVDVEPTSAGKMNILGQVAADDQDHWTGAQVELRQTGKVQFSTQVDDLGAFRAEDIPSGPKELRITPKSQSVVVVSNFVL
jgi:anti-sigma factor RsiW